MIFNATLQSFPVCGICLCDHWWQSKYTTNDIRRRFTMNRYRWSHSNNTQRTFYDRVVGLFVHAWLIVDVGCAWVLDIETTTTLLCCSVRWCNRSSVACLVELVCHDDVTDHCWHVPCTSLPEGPPCTACTVHSHTHPHTPWCHLPLSLNSRHEAVFWWKSSEFVVKWTKLSSIWHFQFSFTGLPRVLESHRKWLRSWKVMEKSPNSTNRSWNFLTEG